MKKGLWVAAIIIVLIGTVATLLAPRLLGFSLWHLGHAVQVATHMNAKLACSARYISDFDEGRIIDDLASYSPAARLVNLQYQTAEKTVTADLYGLAPVKASFRPGIGCSLDFDGEQKLSDLQTTDIPANPDLPWPAGEQVNTISAPLQQQLDQMLAEDNQKGYQSRALLVVQDGKILAESYAQGVTSQTPLLGWSMAKSVTAMLLGRLQYQGAQLTEPGQLFAEWQQDERKELNLTHLLQMSSGLEFDETYAPGSAATHMLFTSPGAAAVAKQSSLQHPPGTHFSYSSGTTNLLSNLLSQQLGNQPQATQDFVYQQLFQPLAMSNSVFEMDAAGDLVGSSYLYASGRDWARLGWLMVNNGKANDQQLLPADWIKAASSPNSSNNEKAYGYQFWLNSGDAEKRWPTLPDDAYAMQGNREQSVMMIPSRRVVLVRLGWTKGDYPKEQNYLKLLELLPE